MKKTIIGAAFLIMAGVVFAQNNSNAEAHYKQGLAFAEKENYDAAINSFSEAIKINPYYAMAFAERGSAYRSRGNVSKNINDFNDAIADFTKAVTINPKLTGVYGNRGLTYFALFNLTYSKDSLDKAEEDFITVLASDPNNKSIQTIMSVIPMYRMLLP